MSVDLLMTDPSISDLHRTRKILDSLLSPAADIVKHVFTKSLPTVYLKFTREFLGIEAEVPTLALVVPELMNTPQVLSSIPSIQLSRLPFSAKSFGSKTQTNMC